MTVYILVLISSIHSPDDFARYSAGFMDVFRQYDGQLLAVTGGSPTVIEGGAAHPSVGGGTSEGEEAKGKGSGEGEAWPYARTVLMSFPSADAFNAWYQSPAYQEVAKLRHESSIGRVVMLDGLPG